MKCEGCGTAEAGRYKYYEQKWLCLSCYSKHKRRNDAHSISSQTFVSAKSPNFNKIERNFTVGIDTLSSTYKDIDTNFLNLSTNNDFLADRNASQNRRILKTQRQVVSVKELIVTLCDFSANRRSKAVERLIQIGAPAVNSLVKMLNHSYDDTRSAACRALGGIGNVRAIGPLVNTLGDKNPFVRREAARALASIGTTAIEPLITGLKDKSSIVRVNAALVLGDIGNVNSIEPLIGLLDDRDVDVKKAAAAALDKMGWKPKNDIEKVHYFIAKAEKNWEVLASLGLIAIGPLCNELRYKYKYECIRINTAKALIKIGKPVVAPLIKMLGYKNTSVRCIATELLGDINDTSAIEPLIKMLKDREPAVRLKTLGALGKINDPKAVEPLIKALEDDKPEVRLKAAKVLDGLGWQPKLVNEKLYYFIARRNWGQIPFLKEVELGPLFKILADKNPRIKEQANETLKKILIQIATVIFGASFANNQQVTLRNQDITKKRDDKKGIVRKIISLANTFSKNNEESNLPQTILHNPDTSLLTTPMNNLNRVLIDTVSYDFHLVERFITYAVNYIGKAHLKKNVEVHIHGNPEKLHQNLRNLFGDLFKTVEFH